jgi:hypothetical protein
MSEPFMPLFHVHPFLQTKTPIHLPHRKERKFPLELQEEKKKTRLDLCLERKEATSKVWTKKHDESSFGGKKKLQICREDPMRVMLATFIHKL